MRKHHTAKAEAVTLEKQTKELIRALKRLAVITALFAADCETQAKYLQRYKLKL